jgi:quinol monooxygenase YgiN
MKLTTTTQVSVDGVMQGPGGPEEDERGRFERGGWAHFDDEAGTVMDEIYERADAFLFGRRTFEPQRRESYLAGCVSVVEQARGTAGCLDFAITADLIDPARVNIFERSESQAAVETFHGSGPSNEQGATMLSVSVVEYDIADVRPFFGKGA